jgi:hypothetical protein
LMKLLNREKTPTMRLLQAAASRPYCSLSALLLGFTVE